MKTFNAFAGLMLSIAILPIFHNASCAEQIQHHGQPVDTGGDIRECVACHDGTLMKNSSFCTVKCDFKSPHSVLKEYPAKGKEGSYVPVGALAEKGIRLFNGKVTCTSCHDLNKPENDYLVIKNKNSNLCLACHLI